MAYDNENEIDQGHGFTVPGFLYAPPRVPGKPLDDMEELHRPVHASRATASATADGIPGGPLVTPGTILQESLGSTGDSERVTVSAAVNPVQTGSWADQSVPNPHSGEPAEGEEGGDEELPDFGEENHEQT